MPMLTPGQSVRDTYVVERLLGEGAFAEVYRVKHRFMGRQAMKVFKSVGATLSDVEAQLKEALLLSSLKHPNIVEVYDANVLPVGGDQAGYFTMTCVPGGTLERHWRSFQNQMMPVEQAVDIMQQVCRALVVAHSSTPPIVHRDVKPQNILIGFDDNGLRVRLSDFGLAKAVNPLSLLLSAKGTLGFKPPEAFANVDSCAGDVWAVGTTLYLLLTDRMPFPLLDERDLDDAGRFLQPMRPPSVYNIGVDAALETILSRSLARSQAERYPDARELLADLESWRPSSKAPNPAVTPAPQDPRAKRAQGDLKQEARDALDEALRIAKDPAMLTSAADHLEEAISKDPALRERYQPQLQLWRKGIAHVSSADLRHFPVRTSKPPEK
jgi:eukaryotic-like serine/threonine-protein kinase